MRKQSKPPRPKNRKQKRKAAPVARRRPRPAIKPIGLAEQPTAPVERIRIGKRHRKEFGDVDGLAASIDARNGLLQPVAVKPLRDSAKYDFDLIAGERRLMAWPRTKFAGQPIPIRIVDVDKIVLGERDENLERKAFTRSEQVAIARECEPIEKAMAIVRQREARQAPRGAAPPKEKPERAGDRVAHMVGMDRQTLERAKAIVEAAEENPGEFGKLAEQMDRTGNVNGPFNRLKILRQSKKLRAEPPPLPGGGPYRVAVFDMPWASEPNQDAPAERGRAFFDYATMSTNEMVAWLAKVRPLLEHPEGCWIWFWTPNFHMIKGVAFDVLERGLGIGADDRVHFRTWRKNKIGRGKVLRGQTEQVLLCRIGNPPPLNLTNQTTSLEGDVRKDSQKPDQFYIDVEALTPAPRYVEFFARRKLPDNWDGFGDQVGTLGATPAPAVDWRAAHVVKAPRPLVNGQAEIAGNFLEIIAAKAAAGEIAWRPDPAGELLGHVEWFGKADFRNGESVEYPPPKKLGFAGAVTIYRTESRVDVAHFKDETGCGFAYSCIPVGKLKKFLTAWSKAATAAPAEAAELQPPAAKKKRGAHRIKLVEPTLPGIPAADPAPVEQNSKTEAGDRADRDLEGGNSENIMPRGPAVRATDVRRQIDAKVEAAPYVEVRSKTHLALWCAFDAISHDCGAGSGYPFYPVPAAGGDVDSLAADLATINVALASLTPEDLATLAIGKQSDQVAIAARSDDLGKAHGLLGAFARGWWKHDDGDQPPPDDQEGIPAFLRRQAADKTGRAA